MMSTRDFINEHVSRIAAPFPLAELFEHLPNVYLYIKNTQSQFLHVNTAFVRLLGAPHLDNVIGKTDFDFFPRYLAHDYRLEDIGVIEGRFQVINKMWLVPRANRNLDWFFSTKLPPQGKEPGEIVGLVGYIRDCKASSLKAESHTNLNAVTDYILQNYSSNLTSRSLAELAGLSVSQLDRRFRTVYQMTPQEFLLRVRIKVATHLLATTDEPIANIAFDTGFFDQSHFSKFFRRYHHVSPKNIAASFVLNHHRISRFFLWAIPTRRFALLRSGHITVN